MSQGTLAIPSVWRTVLLQTPHSRFQQPQGPVARLYCSTSRRARAAGGEQGHTNVAVIHLQVQTTYASTGAPSSRKPAAARERQGTREKSDPATCRHSQRTALSSDAGRGVRPGPHRELPPGPASLTRGKRGALRTTSPQAGAAIASTGGSITLRLIQEPQTVTAQ